MVMSDDLNISERLATALRRRAEEIQKSSLETFDRPLMLSTFAAELGRLADALGIVEAEAAVGAAEPTDPEPMETEETANAGTAAQDMRDPPLPLRTMPGRSKAKPKAKPKPVKKPAKRKAERKPPPRRKPYRK